MPRQRKNKCIRRIEPNAEQWEASHQDAIYKFRASLPSFGDTPLSGRSGPGLNRPDSEMRSSGATSLRAPVNPSAGFSVPGKQQKSRNFPRPSACRILKKCRAKYFSAITFFGLPVSEQTLTVPQARRPWRAKIPY